jgi:hypothetical protein
MEKSSSCRLRTAAEHLDRGALSPLGQCPWRTKAGYDPRSSSPLTSDAIVVAVETMRVGRVNGEAPIGHVTTVQIGR